MAASLTVSDDLNTLFGRAVDALEKNTEILQEWLSAAEAGQPLDAIEAKLEAANAELAERVDVVRNFDVVKFAASRLVASLDELIASRTTRSEL
jgi:hypothetical protein